MAAQRALDQLDGMPGGSPEHGEKRRGGLPRLADERSKARQKLGEKSRGRAGRDWGDPRVEQLVKRHPAADLLQQSGDGRGKVARRGRPIKVAWLGPALAQVLEHLLGREAP